MANAMATAQISAFMGSSKTFSFLYELSLDTSITLDVITLIIDVMDSIALVIYESIMQG